MSASVTLYWRPLTKKVRGMWTWWKHGGVCGKLDGQGCGPGSGLYFCWPSFSSLVWGQHCWQSSCQQMVQHCWVCKGDQCGLSWRRWRPSAELGLFVLCCCMHVWLCIHQLKGETRMQWLKGCQLLYPVILCCWEGSEVGEEFRDIDSYWQFLDCWVVISMGWVCLSASILLDSLLWPERPSSQWPWAHNWLHQSRFASHVHSVQSRCMRQSRRGVMLIGGREFVVSMYPLPKVRHWPKPLVWELN